MPLSSCQTPLDIEVVRRNLCDQSMDSRDSFPARCRLQALTMAVWRRKPEGKVLVHSNQGSQLTSMAWAAFLRCDVAPAPGPEQGLGAVEAEVEILRQMLSFLAERDAEIGEGAQLLSDMGFQHPLHDRGLDRHRLAGLLLHLRCYLGRHQRRHAGGPGHPDIALLPRRPEHQRFRAGAVHQRVLLLLDRELTFLCLIDRQRGAGLQVGRAVGGA